MATRMERGATERSVQVDADGVTLAGNLATPARPRGIVLFAHGSGSSRHSPRNRYVAGVLQGVGLSTLLIDLVTPAEEAVDIVTRHLRFDISLLAGRLRGTMEWLGQQPEAWDPRIGLFGASTGAGAALVAAAARPEAVGAVVSRGGRPDLAGDSLGRVRAPTLLMVGGDDQPVIAMNEAALARLRGEKRLEIVPGATHLFEEPGTLEQVADLASRWFVRFLSVPEGDTVAAAPADAGVATKAG